MGMYGPPKKLNTASGNAPSFSARAWVNFNGNGTVAIRASGNVSSITDNGAGDYTVNFTTAMPDVNYSVSTNAQRGDAYLVSAQPKGGTNWTDAASTSSIRVALYNYNGPAAGFDATAINVSVFR